MVVAEVRQCTLPRRNCLITLSFKTLHQLSSSLGQLDRLGAIQLGLRLKTVFVLMLLFRHD